MRSHSDFWQQNSQIDMFTLGDQIFSSLKPVNYNCILFITYFKTNLKLNTPVK